MDGPSWSRMGKIASSGLNGSTELNFSDLPASLLEAFVPGYSIISRLALQLAGIDIAVFASAAVILFATGTAGLYIWRRVTECFMDFFTSSLYVDDNEDIFFEVMEWISMQTMTTSARSIKAVERNSSDEAEEDFFASDQHDGDVLDEHGNFSFGKWTARVAPRYEPYYGKYHFWYQRRLFFLNRVREARGGGNYWGYNSNRDQEQFVKLTCVGRSTRPLKALLQDVKRWNIEKETALTVIKRPYSRDGRGGRFAGSWHKVTARPSRPLDTVVLDEEQKDRLVSDVNEYLHPSSARWYANRGIPYRRGYLFHGPPGTGKTSLSFALAGIFGLEIYVVSLLEPSLTEGDLLNLFNNLPRRCIILLEDIDSAGLKRDEDALSEKRDSNSPAATSNVGVGNEQKPDDSQKKPGIAITGLLNAIDGVAAQEGRLLVMTTNYPEKLDSALIRPGRVDLQVGFTLATKQQTRELFIRMFTRDEDQKLFKRIRDKNETKSTRGTPAEKLTDAPESNGAISVATQNKSSSPDLSQKELEDTADQFADVIPSDTFSPAEVQGFLLKRKNKPLKALEDAPGWRDAMVASKETKKKVVSGQ